MTALALQLTCNTKKCPHNQVNIEPRLVSNSNGDQAVQRKPLAVGDDSKGWTGYPEKSFKDCGLIKIQPDFSVSFSR